MNKKKISEKYYVYQKTIKLNSYSGKIKES
uniref:Uncharacterized protein n=1 Tax=viral metagenome TaxID=1070528 RepID=A0A6C0IVV3_9ZZZZ